MSKKLLAATLVLACAALLQSLAGAQATDGSLPAIDGERTRGYVEYLASDELGGRRSCTEGYRRAADWVAAHFEEWGLQPAGTDGTWFQEVPIRNYEYTIGRPKLGVDGRDFPLDDGDFQIQSISTVGTSLAAEVVFAGYGISAPDRGLDEYSGLEVEGKIILALKGSPHGAPAARSAFSPRSTEEPPAEKDPWTDLATDAAKAKTAYEKGAVALLLYNPDPAENTGNRRFSRSSRGNGGFEPERDFLCLTIEERPFRAILKRDPQESPRGLTRRLDALRRDIREKHVRSFATSVRVALKGYDAKEIVSEEKGNNKARNVLAKIEGTDPKLKDQYVIFGGHLDHVGTRDGYVNNGADDNASGSAVAMEVIRVLKETGFRPRRTVIAALWCGEELGLIGSNYYADHPCDGVSMDRVVTYFNMDMVGLGDAIGAPGALNFPSIWEVIQRDQDPAVLEVTQPRTGGPGGSDHSPFIVRGIESLALMTSGGGGHPDYHQPEDDAAKIDPEILKKTGQLVMQGVMNLANETEVNLLIENREQLYLARRLQLSNFNPDLEGASWSRVDLAVDSVEALTKKCLDRAVELAKSQGQATQSAQSPAARFGSQAPARKSPSRGVSDLKAFGGDLHLMKVAAELYGFGRIDVVGDDGVWVKDGRLTDAGRQAVPALEEAEFFVHLVSPGGPLLDDFLRTGSKPFLVSGSYAITESTAERIAQRGALLAVPLDPKDVAGFIARAEELKNQTGRRDLLVAWPTSTEGLEDARADVFLGLCEKGWAPAEIAGTRRNPAGIAGGNLSKLVGGGGGRRRR